MSNRYKEEEIELLKKLHKNNKNIIQSLDSELTDLKFKRNLYGLHPMDIHKCISCGCSILHNMGYEQDLYRTCVEDILERFYRLERWNRTSGNIDNWTIGLAVVCEVLEHHDAKVDVMTLLKTYGISLNAFDNTSSKIRIFCKTKYWKR